MVPIREVLGQRNLAKKTLVDCARNLVNSISQSVSTSWEFCFLEDSLNFPLIKKTESFIRLFENYNKAVCDCLVSDCFSIEPDSKMSGIILELLSKLCHIQGGSLEQLLMEPTSQIDHYLNCLKVGI